MGAYLRRLLASGAAYQAARVLAGFLALFTLPLYTSLPGSGRVRLRRDAAHVHHPDEHRPADRHRRGARPVLVRRRRPRAAPERRSDLDGLGVRRHDGRRVGLPGVRGAALRAAARRQRPRPDALRHPRALGVHEPRHGLRAAARRGAPAQLPDRVVLQRAADCRADDHAGGRLRPGRSRLRARQLRRVDARADRAVVDAARSRAAGAADRRPWRARRVRGADRPRRRRHVRAERPRPRLPAACRVAGGGRCLQRRDQAQRGRDRRRRGVPGGLAAARLLGDRRRARQAGSTRA